MIVLSLRKWKPVRAEPVEACSQKLCDAKFRTASSAFARLCPSTGSGRTVLATESGSAETFGISGKTVTVRSGI